MGLEKKNLIQLNVGRDLALKKAQAIIESDFAREAQLDAEVNKRLDELERDQTDQFERHKMFKMLKQKLANEKGIIL